MRHPLRILLIGILLLLVMANLARAWLATQHSAWPAGWQLIAGGSLCWALAFAICANGLIRSRRWAASATIVAYLSYQLYLWLDRLAFVRAGEAMQRTGWLILLSALSSLVIITLAWHVARAPARRASQRD